MLTDRDMSHLRDAMGRSHDYLHSRSSRDMSPRARAGLSAGVAVAEVLAGLAANGYLSASKENFFHPGGTKLPLDLLGGGLLAVAGAMGWLGTKASPHAARFGIGVAGGYFFKLAMGAGAGSRASQNLPPLAVTAGAQSGCGPYGCANAAPYPRQLAPGAASPMGRPLTEAEMAAYARSY